MREFILTLMLIGFSTAPALAQALGTMRLAEPTFVVDQELPSKYAVNKTITYRPDDTHACIVFGPYVATWLEDKVNPPLLISRRISRGSIAGWTKRGFGMDNATRSVYAAGK